LAFDAFISYSHAADGRLAPALQRAMQRLAKPWYRPRALRVFRDESALSANPHLWSSITQALDEAEWFVLLASPEAVASEWVGRELDYWLSNKSADRILVVVTGGTWAWDATARALTGTAVPERLRDALADEPRHVELQWAANEIDLDMHHARFRDVVAQLAAPMHGIAKDELDSEDVRQHRRTRRLARGGVAVLTLLVVVSLVFGTVALLERDDARVQRNRADNATTAAISRGLASDAARMLADHEVDLSLLLSAQSYRFADEGNRSSAEVAGARASLLASLGAEPSLIGFLRGQQAIPQLITYSPDGELVASASDAGDLRVWDADTREPLVHQPEPTGAFVTTLSINRSHLLATATVGPATVRLWDLRTNRPWRWQPPQPQNDVHGNPLFAGAALSDAGILATVTSDEFDAVNSASFQLNLWDVNTGRHLAGPVSLAGTAQPGAFSPTGRLLAVGVRRADDRRLAVDLFDTTTGSLVRTLAGQHGSFNRFRPPGQEFDPFVSIHFSADGTDVTAVASSASDGAVAAWNVATGQRIGVSAAGREQRVLAAAYDGRELVVRDASSGTASVIDAASGRIIAAGLPVPSELSSGVQNEPAAFDPTDRTLAIATAAGTIALLQRDELAGAPTLGHRVVLPGGAFGSAWVAISPTGRIAARLARAPAAPNIGNDVNPGGNLGVGYLPGPPAVRLVDTSTPAANLHSSTPTPARRSLSSLRTRSVRRSGPTTRSPCRHPTESCCGIRWADASCVASRIRSRRARLPTTSCTPGVPRAGRSCWRAAAARWRCGAWMRAAR
jgi:WD40 repeat protein